ncbi:3-carboxy-cis,cis-muconate cycloisomerase [Streptomyces radicis]|uniref:3-carboxy-cis,cis-muconate cycloisomerase n=1 Tax=Streptomyces radicis TaxID=1750517 RepID=A0A3A9VYZ5_9ACTN|nr:3-carboxy-cis,cis-muconate cycloisomerase [Streptomyces radicis]RKN17735.1 3-carboxy-cis,cis-muconate cycloisomerase [Streptomyces radicis]
MGLLSPGWAGSEAEAATGDAAFVRAMLDAEAALARARAAVGLTPPAAAEAVSRAADAARIDPRALALRARVGGNPVIPLVDELTRAVAARDEAAAEHVHRGATSQDILDTALMAVARRARRAVIADLARTADAVAALADAHRATAMPARTLTQHAVPTTFGLKAAGWHTLVATARDRLAGLPLPAQLGGAAGTLAAFTAEALAMAPGGEGARGPEDDPGVRLLRAYARETGLDEPAVPWHALRTPVAELGCALALTTGALGKLAADVLVLSRTEVGEVAEGRGGGSSAMPHKRNPVRATLIAAAARRAPALAATLLGSLAAEDERPAGAWHAEWQALRELLRLAGGAARDAAELAEGLRVDPARMRRNLNATRGLVVSERLALALTPLLGRPRARRLLDEATGEAVARGVPLVDALLAAEPSLAHRLDLAALTDPSGHLGSADSLVDRALGRCAS